MHEPHERRETVRSIALPARRDESGSLRAYLRIASVGDSATYGIGDRIDGRWRGWAALLAESISESHDVSFCNLARPGATVADVRTDQVRNAVAHRPHLTSLIVGLNDTMRSTWDDHLVTAGLMGCAQQLHEAGSVLMTVRFHNHGDLLPLPRLMRRQLSRRVAVLNAAYDEIADRYGALHVDLSCAPEVRQRQFWSVDRLHPSELGHRYLANRFGALLLDAGLDFPSPTPERTGDVPSRREDLRWLVQECGPWVGRRARDLVPWAARNLLLQARLRLA